jgi:hypothetical protein
MGFFRRKVGSPAAGADAGLLDAVGQTARAGAESIVALAVAEGLRLDPVLRPRLLAELERWARSAAAAQRLAMEADGVPFDAKPVSGPELTRATRDLFGQPRPGLTRVTELQMGAVFHVLVLLGFAVGDADAEAVTVTYSDGTSGVWIGTMHGLYERVADGGPLQAAFVAATDSVLWGASMVVALQRLGDPNPGPQPSPIAAMPVNPTHVEPLVTHVLSFAEAAPLFTAQADVFERIPSVTELRMRNADDAEVLALLPGRDGSRAVGRHVILVDAPAAERAILTEIAEAHGGHFEIAAR